MDIYHLIKADHDKMKTLLRRLVAASKADDPHWKELLTEIRDELVPHSRAEEAVLYNSMRELKVADTKVVHSYAEHLEAEAILRSMQAMSAVDVNWTLAAAKLKECLKHHMKEEEDELLPRAQECFSKEEAASMAEAFMAMKPQVKHESAIQNTLDLVVNMMPPRLVDAFKSLSNNTEKHAS